MSEAGWTRIGHQMQCCEVDGKPELVRAVSAGRVWGGANARTAQQDDPYRSLPICSSGAAMFRVHGVHFVLMSDGEGRQHRLPASARTVVILDEWAGACSHEHLGNADPHGGCSLM